MEFQFENEIERQLWCDVFKLAFADKCEETCPSIADRAVRWLRVRSEDLNRARPK